MLVAYKFPLPLKPPAKGSRRPTARGFAKLDAPRRMRIRLSKSGGVVKEELGLESQARRMHKGGDNEFKHWSKD